MPVNPNINQELSGSLDAMEIVREIEPLNKRKSSLAEGAFPARRDFYLLKFCLEAGVATGDHPRNFQISVANIADGKIMQDFRTVGNGSKIIDRLFNHNPWGCPNHRNHCKQI